MPASNDADRLREIAAFLRLQKRDDETWGHAATLEAIAADRRWICSRCGPVSDVQCFVPSGGWYCTVCGFDVEPAPDGSDQAAAEQHERVFVGPGELERSGYTDEPSGTCVVHGHYWTPDCDRCRP